MGELDDAAAGPTNHGSADYLLRTTEQNLMQLSLMADQKASIVLGSSFVMATIVFGDVAGASDLDAVRVMLLITAVLSGACAAVALAPRLRRSSDPRRQPLFFGSIAQMEIDDYQQVMAEILDDPTTIHRTIVADVHAASRVLVASKFRPLQLSYSVLVVGMVLTLVAALLM